MSEVAVKTYIDIDGELMDANLQPPQSDLQAAFRKSGKNIVIDMTAAKEVARDMVRHARVAEFIKNDAATMEALQKGDNAALTAAKTKGNQLRDAPADARINSATTPDELLSVVETISAEMSN